MKKRYVLLSILSVLSILMLCIFTGCNSASKSDRAYWFKDYSEYFIKCTDEVEAEDAGNFWKMTSTGNYNVSLKIKIDVDSYSRLTLKVNDGLITSSGTSGIYNFVYDLNLKTNDKLELHATWFSSVVSDDEGFTIFSLVVSQDGVNYLIKEFDRSTTIS